MKPGPRDHRHKLLICGDELRELKRHTGAMAEAFGLDAKIENYKGDTAHHALSVGLGVSSRRD